MIDYIPISNTYANMTKTLLEQSEKNSIKTAAPSRAACEGSCSGSCSGSCTGGCTGTCTGTCSGGCKGGCKTACTDACKGVCQNRCQNGGQTVSTYAKTKNNSFHWSSNIGADQTIRISATEWNNFASKIEASAPYCGENVSVVRVNSGDVFYASTMNSLLNALNKLNPTSISNKVSGADLIEARDFIGLPDKLNNASINNIQCCEIGETWSKGP